MNCKFKSKKSPSQYKTCEVHCFRLHCRIFYRIIGAMPPSTPQIQILTTFFFKRPWNNHHMKWFRYVVWYIYSKAQFVMIWSRCKKMKTILIGLLYKFSCISLDPWLGFKFLFMKLDEPDVIQTFNIWIKLHL